ncbi:hypothetical protein OH77DRAFT_336108 [Trametes cingulata]|nr:hypothetical protein OH77DRAFT_336108 [Trametes cingulata]
MTVACSPSRTVDDRRMPAMPHGTPLVDDAHYALCVPLAQSPLLIVTPRSRPLRPRLSQCLLTSRVRSTSLAPSAPGALPHCMLCCLLCTVSSLTCKEDLEVICVQQGQDALHDMRRGSAVHWRAVPADSSLTFPSPCNLVCNPKTYV